MENNWTPRTDEYEESIGMEGGFDSNFARGLERELNTANSLLKEMLIDMKRLSDEDMLPDGDHVSMSVVTWADEWAKRLEKE